jgi:hypothetical protein
VPLPLFPAGSVRRRSRSRCTIDRRVVLQRAALLHVGADIFLGQEVDLLDDDIMEQLSPTRSLMRVADMGLESFEIEPFHIREVDERLADQRRVQRICDEFR